MNLYTRELKWTNEHKISLKKHNSDKKTHYYQFYKNIISFRLDALLIKLIVKL